MSCKGRFLFRFPDLWVFYVFLLPFLSYGLSSIGEDVFLVERYATLALTIPFLLSAFLYKSWFDRRLALVNFLTVALLVYVLIKFDVNYLASLGYHVFLLFLVIVFNRYSLLKSSFTGAPLVTDRTLKIFFFITLSITFYILAFREEQFSEGNRFAGFFPSPTTFATWLTVVYLITFHDSVERSAHTIGSVLSFALVWYFLYLSGTRINLLVFTIIGMLSFLSFRLVTDKKFQLLTIVLFFFAILYIYPIYSFLSDHVVEGVLTYRYDEGETDNSFATRYLLFKHVLFSWLNGNWFDFLFGSGLGFSRDAIFAQLGFYILPHNDLLMLLADLGIFFILLFVSLLSYLVYKGGVISFYLVLVYLSSFLHNMVYSHYIMALIFVFVFVYDKRNKY